MTPIRTLRWTTAGLAAAALPVWGHHSHGNYDVNNYTYLEGRVSEVQWINPHTWIYLEVADRSGEVAIWALEGGAPGGLLRRGWTADSVKSGDTIKVRCHQLRDGSNGCLLGFVTPPGGE
jgi:hypothetical protein